MLYDYAGNKINSYQKSICHIENNWEKYSFGNTLF